MNWRQLTERGIAIFGGAVSGGLDSCTITHWLSNNGVTVKCYTVDLGQPDEKTLESVRDRMLACGASDAQIIPAQEDLAQAGLKVIQAQARYEGGYWNTTGIARPITVAAILPKLAQSDIPVFFHGATGKGNDQVRFQLSANILDPALEIYAPWRDEEFLDLFPGRHEMIKYCEANSIPIRPAKESRYSTDANFLGLTHEAGDLEDVGVGPSYVEPGMGVWPWDAPDHQELVTVRWEQGIPVRLDGEDLDLISMFKYCNVIAGRQGVGIGTHVVENRFVGIKSRGIYESPGMELLGRTYEYLLQFVLDRRAREFFSQLSALISNQIYQGYWWDLTTTAALGALDPISRLVTGTIQVRLYKGGVYFERVEDTDNSMPNSLYTDDGSMEALGSYNHADSEGFVKVLGVSARNVGRKQFSAMNRLHKK